MPAASLIPLLGSFGIIAFFYGAVGLGGGSSYIAMMMFWELDHRLVPLVALSLNLLVASGGLWQFASRGHFSRRHFVPLILTSIPSSFFAAQIQLDRVAFSQILGALLLLAGARMLFSSRITSATTKSAPHSPAWLLALLGLILGAIAGLTGIGGGVFLGPVLTLTGILAQKDASGICAGFIVVNSLAGLVGRVVHGARMDWVVFLPAAVLALGFGQWGAYLGSRSWRPERVQSVFGIIVLMVSARILINAF